MLGLGPTVITELITSLRAEVSDEKIQRVNMLLEKLARLANQEGDGQKMEIMDIRDIVYLCYMAADHPTIFAFVGEFRIALQRVIQRLNGLERYRADNAYDYMVKNLAANAEC